MDGDVEDLVMMNPIFVCRLVQCMVVKVYDELLRSWVIFQLYVALCLESSFHIRACQVDDCRDAQLVMEIPSIELCCLVCAKSGERQELVYVCFRSLTKIRASKQSPRRNACAASDGTANISEIDDTFKFTFLSHAVEVRENGYSAEA